MNNHLKKLNLEANTVLVLDNVVDAFTYQLNVTQSYMDAIPDNIHIFAIRRTMPTVSLKRFSSIGRLSVITAGDLIFSKDEVKSLMGSTIKLDNIVENRDINSNSIEKIIESFLK